MALSTVTIRRSLIGLQFPCSRDVLLDFATNRGLAPRLESAMQQLPSDATFDSEDDLVEALSAVTADEPQ